MPCPSMGPNNFGRVPIVLVGSKSFWTGPNYNFSPEKYYWNLTKMIQIQPKQFGHDQNNLDGPKFILDLYKDKALRIMYVIIQC